MSDAPDRKPEQPTRRGGLGRGLGALIPSAPLPGSSSGKGHFWSALDNPPVVDDETKQQLVDDVLSARADRPDSGSPAEGPGQEPAPDDDTRSAASAATERTSSAAVDEDVDNSPLSGPVEGQGDGIPVPDGVAASAPAGVVGAAEPDEEPAAATAKDSSSDGPGHRPPSVAPDDVSRETSPGEPAAVLLELDPSRISANPKNPRQVFDDDELGELSESIKEFGLLQPIVVREAGDGFELIMGERRLRAARLAGVDRIPVIVRQTDDDAMLRDALLENIHRVQLHPLEEAAAYQQLIDEFGVTHEELAQRIKRSRPVISNTIRLLKLPTRVQNRVAAGVLSGSHARALLSLEDSDAQEALANRIVAEGLSVRATEEAVSLHASQGEPTRRSSRRRTVTAPALSALAERLSDHFDTRALVQLGRSKGKIVVEFASVDDLERIISMMAPPLATSRVRDGDAGGEQPGADRER
ncbi:ParB/RepB/Spo0J family partition protein [Cumulibacter manganitolerans]|uniref:ParB/RepB/Spo0J family partition protein n=1 Tax=Cumulibacter manganitolerans TaxID=1884992 RepID=UPI0012959FBC|nr:ParB/RepB/Spo0J family partition protein [Cumulibacter manganitolerans]